MRRAKIICTIGPASVDGRVIRKLIKGGMNVARLNFSHGTYEFHTRAIKTIREQAKRLGKTVAIMQDLQGIKIRVGAIKGGGVQLKKGQEITIKEGKALSGGDTIFINYPHLIKGIEKGERILFADGMIQARVREKGRDYLRAVIKSGGLLEEKKGVNIPGLKPLEVSFTKKDVEDLHFVLGMGIDYIALSFVRRAEDVLALKNFLKKEKAPSIPVIAKIETPLGLKNIEGILKEADGIMIARGDLGVEIPPEDVPFAQKSLIKEANRAGKTVIVATEMLESMTNKPRPTRAETTDVANAVLDGADAVMLSQETSIGQYPVESLQMMARIILETERTLPIKSRYEEKGTFSEAVAEAAAEAAESVRAKYIIGFTQSGYTARLLSMLRPQAPIIAFSPSEEVMRRMALFWGVASRKIKRLKTMELQFREVEKALLAEGLAQKGDSVVITSGIPGKQGTTRLMKLHVIEKE
jgi:pyruvate kinase